MSAWKRSVVIMAMLGIASCARVENETMQAVVSPVTAIDKTINNWMGRENITGVQVSVVRNGHVIVDKGYGVANLRTGASVSTSTRFRVDSISKQFTAAETSLMLSSHRIDPSTRVKPTTQCRTGYGAVRFIDLIDHTASYGTIPDAGNADDHLQLNRRLKTLCGHVRSARTWTYRNDDYLVLSDEIAALSRRRFDEAIESGVFRWANMESASFQRRPDDARGYDCSRGQGTELLDSAEGSAGAGGAIASAGDIARWNMKLLAGQYPDRHRDVFAGGAAVSDHVRYSYGFELIDDQRYGRIARHNGYSGGFSSINVLFLDHDIAVTILTNCDNIDTLDMLSNNIYGLVS
jgi:CubicO group peptidase (beta-lactamase class C family)